MSTGRAKGKHTPRMGEGSGTLPAGQADSVDPDSPLGHKLGVSKRTMGAPSPIPGGEHHIINQQTFRNRPATPHAHEKPETPDQNAHGVPPESHTGYSRAQNMRGKSANNIPDVYYSPQKKPIRAIPVYVVENDDREAVFRTASPYNVSVPGSATDTSDMPRLCGRDPRRSYVLILNESTVTNIRIAQRASDLMGGVGGALIPWPTNSYTKIATQDELYAVSVSSTAATVSVIQVFEQAGSGD